MHAARYITHFMTIDIWITFLECFIEYKACHQGNTDVCCSSEGQSHCFGVISGVTLHKNRFFNYSKLKIKITCGESDGFLLKKKGIQKGSHG